MRTLKFNIGATGRRIVVVLAFLAATASGPESTAQTAGSPQWNTASPTATTVYEAGDVYLPSSRVYVFVGKTGLGHEHGVVGQLQSGRLRLDAPQEAGQLVFDMRSFAADTDAARKFVGLTGTSDAATQRDVTANMLGGAVLDVARYPVATFTVANAVRMPQLSPRGLPQYQLGGDFALHGVTNRIQVIAEAEETNGWTHLLGGFSIRQTQYGITPFSKAFGALGVTDDVKIWGDLWLSKTRQNVPIAQTHQ